MAAEAVSVFEAGERTARLPPRGQDGQKTQRPDLLAEAA